MDQLAEWSDEKSGDPYQVRLDGTLVGLGVLPLDLRGPQGVLNVQRRAVVSPPLMLLLAWLLK